MTEQGLVLGTVPYMSPEQLEGRVVDHRTDLFSVGILFYEMLCGQQPFGGEFTDESMSDTLPGLLPYSPLAYMESNSSPILSTTFVTCLENFFGSVFGFACAVPRKIACFVFASQISITRVPAL